jgi:hypothetical protein
MGDKMKKLVIFSVMLAVTLFAFNAQALTNYDSSFTRITPISLEAGDAYGKLNAFSGPLPVFTTAYLDITLSNVISGPSTLFGTQLILPPIGAFFASINQTNFLFASSLHNGLNTFALTGDALKNLNAAITQGGISFGLLLANGGITFKSARLYGTLAPEPLSMALLGAGLVGLPFARRLKKVIRKEA